MLPFLSVESFRELTKNTAEGNTATLAGGINILVTLGGVLCCRLLLGRRGAIGGPNLM